MRIGDFIKVSAVSDMFAVKKINGNKFCAKSEKGVVLTGKCSDFKWSEYLLCWIKNEERIPSGPVRKR